MDKEEKPDFFDPAFASYIQPFQASPIAVSPIPEWITETDREALERLLSYPPDSWKKSTYESSDEGCYYIVFETVNPNSVKITVYDYPRLTGTFYGIATGIEDARTLRSMRPSNVGEKTAEFIFRELNRFESLINEQEEQWFRAHDPAYRKRKEAEEAEERHRNRPLIDRL